MGIGTNNYGGQVLHLSSAGWRTRKTDGIIQSKSEGLGTKSSDVRGQENYINTLVYFPSIFLKHLYLYSCNYTEPTDCLSCMLTY